MEARRGMLVEIVARHRGELCLVDRDELVIGRDRSCHLPLLDASVARRHARICRSDGGWTIEDLSSAGGTFVNDLRIRGAHRLRPGDRILVGRAALHVVTLDHVADPGEHTGPLERHASYACRSVTCAIDITLCTATGSTALERELDELVGAGMTEALATADPVGVVLGARDAMVRLRDPVANIAVAAQITRVLIDADALALLRDTSDAARAAWSWLRNHPVDVDLVEPIANVVGVDHGYRIDRPVPPELLAPAAGPGLLLWISDRHIGQLVRVDRPMRLESPEDPTSPDRFVVDLERDGATWRLISLARDRGRHVLEVGVPIEVCHTVVTPIAI